MGRKTRKVSRRKSCKCGVKGRKTKVSRRKTRRMRGGFA